MIKKTFIYIIVVVFVGITAWFFMQKAKNTANEPDLNSLVNDEAAKKDDSKQENNKIDMTKEGEWVKLPNGLQLLDTLVGYGKEAREGDVVSAHYTGTLKDGTKFDSSVDRGEPFSFVLGGGMVIKGWDIGLVGMKVGGKRKLIIPPDLGYGSRGAGGVIPPNATLYFDIELVAAETPKAR